MDTYSRQYITFKKTVCEEVWAGYGKPKNWLTRINYITEQISNQEQLNEMLRKGWAIDCVNTVKLNHIPRKEK